jgi:hypothetical protein
MYTSPRRAPRLLVSGRTRSTSTSPCAATTCLRPHALYVNLAVRRDYSSPAARALRQPCRALRLLRLVTRLVAPLVVDYSASRRLVVDYSASVACPGASTHRAARHAALAPLVVDYSASRRLVVDYSTSAARPGASARHVDRHAARRRLLRLRRASGCLGTSRGPSHGSSSTTPCAVTSSCGHAGSTSATPCDVTTCLAATLALLRVLRAPPRRFPVASCRPFILTSFPN